MIDLVICNYNNDLRWLPLMEDIDYVHVYDKSNCNLKPLQPKEVDPRPFYENNQYLVPVKKQIPKTKKYNIIDLPNIGAEHQTYLHHIINNYNSLADMTIFCQGHPFDHLNNQFLITNEQFFNIVKTKNYYVHENGYIDLLGCFNKCDIEGRTIGHNDNFSLNLMPIIEFVNYAYEFTKPIPYQSNGIFAATRKSIKNVPLEIWKKINYYLITKSYNDWCSEEVYKMERLWYFILNGDSLPKDYRERNPLPGLTWKKI